MLGLPILSIFKKWRSQKSRNFYGKASCFISAAGNAYWEGLYFNLRDRIEMYGSRLSFDREWFAVAVQDHHDIIDAVLEEDFERGKEAMVQHIRNVRRGIARIRAAQHPY